MPCVQPDLFQRLCRARELLREGGPEAPSVEEVARRVAVSRYHLARRFEALFGASPRAWRTSWRLERAKQLLAESELDVTEVCLEVGFASLGSFSALFRRRVGCSPSEWRRRARGGACTEPGCLDRMVLAPPGTFRTSGEA